MKVAVLSDIHDDIWKLDKVVKRIKKDKCEAVIFCGDLCAPFTAEVLSRAKIRIFLTWGNVDSDPWGIVKKGGEYLSRPPEGQDFNDITLGKRKIAFSHFPDVAKTLSKTGYYDAVFYGHTHIYYRKKMDNVLIANPGAVCGIVKGKPGDATFMVYDTKVNDVELINI